ncbi:hypothetical protein [Burkholderia cenocepacia]|uniref:hypothetical protein n=1 Tax=Burkholderia cenocepacia TaxID=95486 RepID=UPI001F3F243F|nr:hypothetical protein [Burkholderia cenocepacia]
MGILLRDEQASYRANAKGMIFPISDAGLELLGVFGGDVAASSRNFAPGKPAFTPVGNIQVSDNSIVVSGDGGYLQTEMADPASMTLIAIVKPLEMQPSLLLSNYQSKSQVHSGNTIGASLHLQPFPDNNDGLLTPNFQRAVTDGSASIGSGVFIDNDHPLAAYQFHCARYEASTHVRQVQNLTSGHSAVWTSETRAPDLGERMRIGGGYDNGGFGGRAELVAVIGMSRAIADAEVTTLYKFWKGYCERRGIVI